MKLTNTVELSYSFLPNEFKFKKRPRERLIPHEAKYEKKTIFTLRYLHGSNTQRRRRI